jgi:hypothetical protein
MTTRSEAGAVGRVVIVVNILKKLIGGRNLKIEKRSKWLSLFVIVAILASMLLMQTGMASAATRRPYIYPAGGAFTTAQTVTIYNITNGDTAYYTTDGTSPVNSGTHITYTGPFTVSQSETVQAVVYYSTTGWSAVASATFTINGSSSPQAPVISPNGGAFTTTQTVSISSTYGWGTIYYTTDGSSPVTSNTRIAYRWPFTIYQSETIEVANYSSAGWSGVTSATFTINGSSSLQTPVISPNGGAFTTDQTVSISNTYGGTIYYTTDGSNPTNGGTAVLYSGPFTVYQSETIEAASDTSAGWSAVTSATFTFGNSSTIQTGSNSAQIAQLEQELVAAISSNQMAQAAQILQQIQQLETQNASGTQLSNLEQQLITEINSGGRGKWARVEAIMKQIAKIEASEGSAVSSSWVYPLLGQAYQQQGNNNINVFNGGNQIDFDVQPIIINGRTLIPIRQVANAFGISNNNINWNPNGTVAINNGSSQIQFSNNGQQAYLNGASYGLDVPAQIVNGRMMVPLRAIGQMFHRNVQWYPNGRIVTIQ